MTRVGRGGNGDIRGVVGATACDGAHRVIRRCDLQVELLGVLEDGGEGCVAHQMNDPRVFGAAVVPRNEGKAGIGNGRDGVVTLVGEATTTRCHSFLFFISLTL